MFCFNNNDDDNDNDDSNNNDNGNGDKFIKIDKVIFIIFALLF